MLTVCLFHTSMQKLKSEQSCIEMCNLWLTSSILSTVSRIQTLANEAKSSLLQTAGFSLLPLQNLCRGECPYFPVFEPNGVVRWCSQSHYLRGSTQWYDSRNDGMSSESSGNRLKLSERSCWLCLNQETLRGLEAAWFKLTCLCPRLREQYLGRLDCQTGFKSRKEKSSE